MASLSDETEQFAEGSPPVHQTRPQHAVGSDAPGVGRAGWWVITITAGMLLVMGVVHAVFGPVRYWTPVPVVFLAYFFVSGAISLVFWTGVSEIRAPELNTHEPAPLATRAAAAAGAVGVASALVLLPVGLTDAPANALPCPDGSNTCGPTAPTFDPGPTQGGNTTAPQAPQTTIPGYTPPNTPAAPTQGTPNDGGNFHVQTPDFGTPEPGSCIVGCDATPAQPPRIPGNEATAPTAGQSQNPAQQNPVTTAPNTPRVPTSTPKLRTPVPETTTSTTRNRTVSDRDNNDRDENRDEDRPGWPYAVAELAAVAGTYRRRTAWANRALRDGRAVADNTITEVTRDATVVSKPSASSVPAPAPPVGSDNQAVYGSESGIANRLEGATDLRANGWAVVAYFKGSGKPTAASFLSHYLGNSGTPMTLPASTVDAWTSEATTAYQTPVKGAVDTLRNEALQAALQQAKDAGQTVTTSGNTRWIAGVSGNSEDSVTTLGRYAVSVAYSVTMDPDGNFSMAWRPDVSDYYNFSPQGDWGDIQHQTSSNMVKLYELGYANEFLVTGSGTVQSLAGTI